MKATTQSRNYSVSLDLTSAAEMALTQMEQAGKQYSDDPDWQTAFHALRKALAVPVEPSKVYVLTFDTDAGLGSYVYATRAVADTALFEYVEENWGDVMGVDTVIPADNQAAIDAYFAKSDDRAEISECEVES